MSSCILLPPSYVFQSTKTDKTTAGFTVPINAEKVALRFSRQLQADRSKSAVARNRLGQFSTPYPLACKMAKRCLSHIPADQPLRFLEPALGSGVFFSALTKEMGERFLQEAVGVEVDPLYAEIARAIWPADRLAICQGDFFPFAADAGNHRRSNLLCTNPPYVRHHHLDPDWKLVLQARVKSLLGLEVSGLAGLYVYFMLLADALLAPDAVASWLLPSEFLFVNYGKVLREYLTRHVTLLDIHQFDPDEVQFDDALVSSCVVTYRKRRPTATDQFTFQFGGDLLYPKRTSLLNAFEQTGKPKWSFALPDEDVIAGAEADLIRLGDLFQIRRGIATGANDFFVVNREIAEKYAIPSRFLKPLLPSPRYLKTDVIEADADGMPLLDEVDFLLDCNLPPAQVQSQFPGLWEYLQAGVAQGIPQGYLCASREFWYSQEQREPSPFLVSYMGRINAAGKSPIRFIINYSRAISTNVYLHLYPTPKLRPLLAQEPARLSELHALLNTVTLADLARNGRVYGGGLHKVEPKEIAGVPLSNLPSWLLSTFTPQPALLNV